MFGRVEATSSGGRNIKTVLIIMWFQSKAKLTNIVVEKRDKLTSSHSLIVWIQLDCKFGYLLFLFNPIMILAINSLIRCVPDRNIGSSLKPRGSKQLR